MLSLTGSGVGACTGLELGVESNRGLRLGLELELGLGPGSGPGPTPGDAVAVTAEVDTDGSLGPVTGACTASGRSGAEGLTLSLMGSGARACAGLKLGVMPDAELRLGRGLGLGLGCGVGLGREMASAGDGCSDGGCDAGSRGGGGGGGGGGWHLHARRHI